MRTLVAGSEALIFLGGFFSLGAIMMAAMPKATGMRTSARLSHFFMLHLFLSCKHFYLSSVVYE